MSLHVFVANPLPSALRSYTDALSHNLREAGAEVKDIDLPGMEVGEGGRRRRLWLVLTAIVGRIRILMRPRGVVICVWPGFGLLEPITWVLASARHHVAIVYHDPVPIRRQFGYSRASLAVFRATLSMFRNIEVLAHSELARTDIKKSFGVQSALVPHPIRSAGGRSRASGDGRVVSVLGQYKPERTMDPLDQIAATHRGSGIELRIVGRGWPPVPGWTVSNRFVTEEEFSACIQESVCVVIPYARFYQSGVAARCLEQGTAVLAPRHENIAWLFGQEWPGMVDDQGDWSTALTAILDGHPNLEVRAEALEAEVVTQWGLFLTAVQSPGASP